MRWYCVMTLSRQEDKARLHLQAQGIPNYFPKVRADKRIVRKERPEIVYMFPGYGFVKLSEEQDDFGKVGETPGVVGLLRIERKDKGELVRWPAPVKEGLVEGLMELESESGVHEAKHDYQQGDRVRIKEGPLHGYEAMVTGTESERISALLEGMGKEHKVRFEYHQVEPA